MDLALSSNIAGRQTEFPAAVLAGLLVRTPDGRTHSRRWEGIIDTGADLLVVPVEIGEELRLSETRQRVRVWTYRKDDQPSERYVYFVRLVLPSNLEVLTKAITSERRNILIGRSALAQMRLMIDWPANRWSLDQVSLSGAG